MCFSTFLQDATMFRANFIGFSIFAVYISIYFYYVDSKDKIKALKKIIIAIAIVGAMFAYTKYEDPNLVAKRFGIFLTALLYCLIATPLLHIPKVFKTKSTARLPLPMILTGTVAGSLWLTYGVILQSGFMIVSLNFLLNSIKTLFSYNIHLHSFFLFYYEASTFFWFCNECLSIIFICNLSKKITIQR